MCMIWKNTKIKLSKGLAFYAEKESIYFSKEASRGWQLKKISPLGFYVFKKAAEEESTWVIDFYSGKKEDINEYVEFYQDSGWSLVENYRNRYFVFKSTGNHVFNYTDRQTYKERLKNETVWMLLQSLWAFFPSLFIYLILFYFNHFDMSLWLRAIISGVLFLGIIFPVMLAVLLLYFKMMYRKRPELYNNPKAIDKSQKFGRDMVIAMIIGALFGFISSMLFFNQ
ncbi:hypothetical protein CBF36_05085 [Vagococcus bubulae]|uniref:DUF2812 domain-containing protein n=2 Tax=Vagococcus bubulae TaxID=1977868 RepID=A0A429ZLN2_9ENTE|nr:hypothetical protein CBF36_05085 [Vagococcus bubulae]